MNAQTALPATSPMATAPTAEAEQGITVLLIDDQAIVAEAVRRLLADQTDIKLHYCPDPAQCVELAERLGPTVILLDLVMPDVDGIAMTRTLRAHPVTAMIPIIVLSSREDPQVKSDAFGAGATDYLIKLPDKVELIARIRSHSASYLNLLRYDAILLGLRESEERLRESNAALTEINQAYARARADADTARQDAERANAAKSDFLSRMSHELRTPLNAVLGFAQLLEVADMTSENQTSVQYILRGGRYLLELINEVLDLARIESGRLELSLEPVATALMVEATLTLVRPQAAQKKIEIVHQPLSADSFVMADRQRFGQILLNLFSNAVKYTPEDGQVTVWCESVAGDRMRILVRDTGFGIAPEKLPRLFTAFDRLGIETTGIEGTGLGLALSKTLAEAMDGSIGVESSPGAGSTFWLELNESEHPMFELSVADSSYASDTAIADNRAIDDPCTVLYIEDNVANFALIEAVLSHRPSIRLLKAVSGAQGLELARQGRPDLILLDLHLPDTTGFELLRSLQQDPGTHDIPIIVVSADATPRQRDRLLEAGARKYLTKPLVIKRLLDAIDELLRERCQSESISTD